MPVSPDAARAVRRLGAAILVVCVTGLLACTKPAPPAPAALPVLERPVLELHARSVPAAALVERGGIPGVFVLQEAAPFPPAAADAHGKPLPQARFRMVKTGPARQQRVEVLSGLAGNEVLVLGDLSAVRDGALIVAERRASP